MKAEIITSGTELLLGEIVDTNAPFIANQLAALGIDLYYVSIVGDNYERYLGVLRQAWTRSDIVITTGGLGPTQGDITRNVIAGLIGEKAYIDDNLKEVLAGYFKKLGFDMPQNNLKQATLIPSATAMPNPLGTAPGWWVEKDGRIIIALPGPPLEMQPMWNKEVLPRLGKKSGSIILSRTLKVWGLAEARLDQLMSPYLSSSNPTLAMYAKADGIHLRITAKAAEREIAHNLISEREAEIRDMLKDNIWGADDDAMERMVGQLLIDRGATLGIVESFTRGFLTYTLANIPESHRFLKGSIVANPTRAIAMVGMKKETIASIASEETAVRMASLARVKFEAAIGIGVDGRLDSDGGVPVGRVYIAIDSDEKRVSTVQHYSVRANLIIKRATNQALFNLKTLLHNAMENKSGVRKS